MPRRGKDTLSSEDSQFGQEENGGRVLNKVPLCIQSYSWDCGLACACMVLQYLGKDSSHVYTSDLEKLNCGQSIWTIDLAALMCSYKIPHTLCTVTLGVDKNYSKQSFYSRKFSADEERVSKLFAEAETLGINVQQRSVPIDEMMSHLETGNLCIVLVDWNQLECLWCDQIRCKSRCFPCLSTRCCTGYQGHYIVVCGYQAKKKRIFYKNPSYDEDLCCSHIDQFNAARKSYGTDEDILFIYKDEIR